VAQSKEPTFAECYEWFGKELNSFELNETHIYYSIEYNIIDLARYCYQVANRIKEKEFKATVCTGAVIIVRIV
jgi:hypothetical protein